MVIGGVGIPPRHPIINARCLGGERGGGAAATATPAEGCPKQPSGSFGHAQKAARNNFRAVSGTPKRLPETTFGPKRMPEGGKRFTKVVKGMQKGRKRGAKRAQKVRKTGTKGAQKRRGVCVTTMHFFLFFRTFCQIFAKKHVTEGGNTAKTTYKRYLKIASDAKGGTKPKTPRRNNHFHEAN